MILAEVANSLAGEISYGQQKLLTLACCVANGAKLLLLDEPIAGIQPIFRSYIVNLLKQLKVEGTTILIIEHDTDFISEVADEMFFLNNGAILSYKNLSSFKADPLVIEAYL